MSAEACRKSGAAFICGRRSVCFGTLRAERRERIQWFSLPTRPGLPRDCSWQSDERRQRGILLGFKSRQCRWHAFGFPHDLARSRFHRTCRPRYSVALPLGINGAARHSKDGNLNPKRVGRPGGTATLEAERRVASRPVGGVRLARFFKPQEVSPTHHSKFAPFFQMRLRRALLMLFAASKSATSSAELQSVAWGGGELRGSKSRKSTAPFCGIRPRRAPQAPLMRRSHRGRRFYESRYSLSAQSTPPVLRPVSASLRLRFRSATAVARGNSCRIGQVPTGRICHLSGRATDFCA